MIQGKNLEEAAQEFENSAQKPPKEKTFKDYCKESGLSKIKPRPNLETIKEPLTEFARLTAGLSALDKKITMEQLKDFLEDKNVKGGHAIASEIFKKPEKKKGGEDSEDTLPGKPLDLELPEPWHEPVKTYEILDHMLSLVKRFLFLPEHADKTIALWHLFAWAFPAFWISPRLYFFSPEKECGKSTALKLLFTVSPKAAVGISMTTASLFRTLEQHAPTMFLDEADQWINEKGNEDLKAILNTGHTIQFAYVLRVAGDEHEVRKFTVFCPIAVGCKGRLWDTFESRCIPIKMQRASGDLDLEDFSEDPAFFAQFSDFKRKCCRWSQDNIETLRKKNISRLIPKGLSAREKDNWNPLFKIAALADEELLADGKTAVWVKYAQEAAIGIAESAPPVETLGVKLLTDIRAVWYIDGKPEKMHTADIIAGLEKMEDRGWDTHAKGKPITGSKMGWYLEKYDIKSTNIRLNGGVKRGYLMSGFNEAWPLYTKPYEENPENCSTSCSTSSSTSDTDINNENNDVAFGPLKRGSMEDTPLGGDDDEIDSSEVPF